MQVLIRLLSGLMVQATGGMVMDILVIEVRCVPSRLVAWSGCFVRVDSQCVLCRLVTRMYRLICVLVSMVSEADTCCVIWQACLAA